jgi:hypothetical protein
MQTLPIKRSGGEFSIEIHKEHIVSFPEEEEDQNTLQSLGKASHLATS